jgi:hypothetical protein
MSTQSEDRRALFLMLSLLLFFLTGPFVSGNRIGELLMVLLFCWIMVAAILELVANPLCFRAAIPLAVMCFVLALLFYFHRSRTATFLYFGAVVLFLGVVSVGLFSYLGRKGAVTPGRLYGSVSLYFILAFFWYGIYNLIYAAYPESFSVPGYAPGAELPGGVFLYYSMETLTTLGYGDIVPVHPAARAMASLEAATGVLYLAITVARLVSAYQQALKD